jgi:Fe-S-cluster-containing hydrogenase component 2
MRRVKQGRSFTIMIFSPSPAPADQDSASLCATCPADCLEACFNDAISAVAGGVRIATDDCAGCGACIPACDFELIRLRDGVAHIVSPEILKPASQGRAPVRV